MSFKQERIVPIYKMLFEMARGNFNTSIPLAAINDELETLAVLLNMVAEEMRESIFHEGYVSTHHENKEVNHIAFILDKRLFIKSFTAEISFCSGFEGSRLLGNSIEGILIGSSFKKLEKVIQELSDTPTSMLLDFITKEQMLVTVNCSIVRLIDQEDILLQFNRIIRQQPYDPEVNTKGQHSITKIMKADAILIQKLYDYIMAHLEEPLPSIKELSRQFGTNEYKLKSGFRYFFKTSIYQFYNEERLKRAFFMIEHTQIPLKNISVMNGFNNYPNFSKAFKKRFGISPFEVVRVDDGNL
ncbi:helix-turn-helix transcriptional regulator [Flavobacterium flavipallidum]|uniref:AraC family transcriptional regulator n=1 Tax=Flavobacterium flavipallidum TaxID=3139140 RepID=A0ABU9HK22_9FLAO